MPVPTVRATLVAPEPLLNERSFLRIHNRCAKEALRAEGLDHHKRRIPQHFTRSAHAKYGYMRRKDKYMRIKARRYHSATDLVKSGATKQEMLQNTPKIRIGGKAADDAGASGELKLTLELNFPFSKDAQAAVAKRIASRRRFQRTYTYSSDKTGVTIAQMKKEIATITPTRPARSPATS
jgi:hypothetical protein